MIRHIAAIDSQRGIAKQGQLPWDLPADTAYYKRQVRSHGGVVLVAGATYRQMRKPLPGLHNYVWTRDTKAPTSDAEKITNLDEFFRGHPDVWIIGGGQLYAATIDRAEELYITEIDHDFDCDTFYPDFISRFTPIATSPVHTENGLNYRFVRYQRAGS